jgi:hypothetical protein
MPNIALSNPSIKIISDHGFAEVIENLQTNQKSLHALQPFKEGEVISLFSAGEICSIPNYLTVQTGVDTHITLVPVFLQYINHSCEPNVFFDTTSLQLFALKDIAVHAELTFFYPSTEWNMAQPFICFCGSGDCLRNIKGAMYLSPDQLKKYKLTDFIKQQLLQP